MSGGGSQAASTFFGEDEEDEMQIFDEGMTQLRGEATKDQDKFRITVEREQKCCGFCGDICEPVFEPGATSVTLTGVPGNSTNTSSK